MITAVDLFAGPGGWDFACKQLGLDPLGIEWFTPSPTKRGRAKACSSECARALMSKSRGTEKGSAKLNGEKVAEIRRRVADGERQKDLCAEFGVSAGTMSLTYLTPTRSGGSRG